jgi:hypothetical protein
MQKDEEWRRQRSKVAAFHFFGASFVMEVEGISFL